MSNYVHDILKSNYNSPQNHGAPWTKEDTDCLLINYYYNGNPPKEAHIPAIIEALSIKLKRSVRSIQMKLDSLKDTGIDYPPETNIRHVKLDVPRAKLPTQYLLPTKEDTTMTTETAYPFLTPLTLTSQVLLNGCKITEWSDQEIYALIAAHEANLERLEAIKHKPAKLKQHIDDVQTKLLELITYLDNNNTPSY